MIKWVRLDERMIHGQVAKQIQSQKNGQNWQMMRQLPAISCRNP